MREWMVQAGWSIVSICIREETAKNLEKVKYLEDCTFDELMERAIEAILKLRARGSTYSKDIPREADVEMMAKVLKRTRIRKT